MKIAAAIILSAVLTVVSGPVHKCPESSPWESLALSASYVPENEKFIHIGGGYFAHFNGQTGIVGEPGNDSSGSIRFHLESLGWESRFVYLPGGELSISLSSGEVLELTMEKLDYVEIPRSGRPLYRLTAVNEDIRAVFIADSPENDSSGTPHLEGILILKGGGAKYSVSKVSITGRNEYDAERHLNRVVDAASDFSNMDI